MKRRLTRSLPAVFAAGLIGLASPVWAESRDEVDSATARWGEALGENDPDRMLRHYASDAVLWGTLSPIARADPAALRSYFVSAFEALPELTVTFGERWIRVYGDAAVNTGYYTFRYRKNGELRSLPARYSFTFVKQGGNWMIVDHHSSAMPAAPK